jgi:hypothetical protein
VSRLNDVVAIRRKIRRIRIVLFGQDMVVAEDELFSDAIAVDVTLDQGPQGARVAECPVLVHQELDAATADPERTWPGLQRLMIGAAIRKSDRSKTEDRSSPNRRHVPADWSQETTMIHDNTLPSAYWADPVSEFIRPRRARKANASLCSYED